MKNYNTIGILCEYDPFHNGHAHHIAYTRAMMGPESVIICVMSGNFTQRGAFAMFSKHSRARCALSAADIVFEMPLSGSLSSSEDFALQGVRILNAVGADYISFGSEVGEIAPLEAAAEAMLTKEFSALIVKKLKSGSSYASCAQTALGEMLPDISHVLKTPNNLLGIEYIKAIRRTGSGIIPFTLKREPFVPGDPLRTSSSAVRRLLLEGSDVSPFVPEATAEMIREEFSARIAPVLQSNCTKALMHSLRSLSSEQIAKLPRCGEGLENKLKNVCREAGSPERVVEMLKSKRYAQSRLRRLVLCAVLGLDRDFMSQEPAYIRLLGANRKGREFLHARAGGFKLPVLTKPASVKHLSGKARSQFEAVVRATDVFELARPGLEARPGGLEWKCSPIMIP